MDHMLLITSVEGFWVWHVGTMELARIGSWEPIVKCSEIVKATHYIQSLLKVKLYKLTIK